MLLLEWENEKVGKYSPQERTIKLGEIFCHKQPFQEIDQRQPTNWGNIINSFVPITYTTSTKWENAPKDTRN